MNAHQIERGQVMEAIASALRAAYTRDEIVSRGVNIIDLRKVRWVPVRPRDISQAIRYRCLECCQSKFRCECR